MAGPSDTSGMNEPIGKAPRQDAPDVPRDPSGSAGAPSGQARTASDAVGEPRSFAGAEGSDPASNEQEDARKAHGLAQARADAKAGDLDDKRGQSDLGGMNTTGGV
jgi:hypothetical protein